MPNYSSILPKLWIVRIIISRPFEYTELSAGNSKRSQNQHFLRRNEFPTFDCEKDCLKLDATLMAQP